MATGIISGDKVKVTGFHQSTENEETYKVIVSGTSTAEGSAGSSVVSNMAVVKHEKQAAIILTSGATPCDGYEYAIGIEAVNIKKGTLSVISYPIFVSNYTMYEDRLCYDVYPNFNSGFTDGSFTIGGFDIYNNLITSDSSVSPGDDYDDEKEKIELHRTDSEEIDFTIPHSATGFSLKYELDPEYVTSSSTEVCETIGEIVTYQIVKGVSGGSVSVKVLPSENTTEKVYKVRVCGKNRFGNTVVSNTVVVRREPVEQDVDFYLSGEDIYWTATNAMFSIHVEGGEVSNIGIVRCEMETCGETSPLTGRVEGGWVVVDVPRNETTCGRMIFASVSAVTQGGTVLYGEGTLTQGPKVELLVEADDGTYSTAVTSGTYSRYFDQTRSIRYMSVNVSNVTAEVVGHAGMDISVNPTTKTVTVTMGRNEDHTEKTYTVALNGIEPNGNHISATYVFTQARNVGGDFKLTSGTSESVDMEYNTTAFTLNITAPSEYTNIGVSMNTSNSPQYRIYRTAVSGNALLCSAYTNTSQNDVQYQIQLSGSTPEGIVVYTNVFTVKHLYNHGSPDIMIAFASSSASVSSSSTEYSGIRFNCTGLTHVGVEEIVVSDDSFCDCNITYTPGASSGTCRLTFGSNPPEERTIRLKLNGYDVPGNICITGVFTLTQGAAEESGIIIRQNPIRLDDNKPRRFTYSVSGTGLESGSLGVGRYDSSIFSGVSLTGANIIVENKAMGADSTKTYYIVFTGRTVVDQELIYKKLEVQQPGDEGGSVTLVIASEERYYNYSTDKYEIPSVGDSYEIYIVSGEGIDYSKPVTFIITPSGNATGGGDANNLYVSFNDAGGGSDPQPAPYETGRRINDTTILIPAGNGSYKYLPKLLEVTKNGGEEEGDYYKFTISLEDNTGEGTETRVQIKAKTYAGTTATSNTITFVQEA